MEKIFERLASAGIFDESKYPERESLIYQKIVQIQVVLIFFSLYNLYKNINRF